MKFLLDENTDRRLVPFLIQLGHDVTVIAIDYPHRLFDHEILAIAVKEKRILLTQDVSDFGDLIFRHHHPHCGVILFRFKSEETNIDLRKDRLAYVLRFYADQLNQFLVVTPISVRIRKSPISLAA
jgi:predicted nuclease of predicted toxin-antitoxin system